MEGGGLGAPRRESLLDVVLGELQKKGRGDPVGRLLYVAPTRGVADDGGKALAEFHRNALQRAGEVDGGGGDAGGLLVAFPNVVLHVVEGAPGMLTALLRIIAGQADDSEGLLLGARVLAVRSPPSTAAPPSPTHPAPPASARGEPSTDMHLFLLCRFFLGRGACRRGCSIVAGRVPGILVSTAPTFEIPPPPPPPPPAPPPDPTKAVPLC